MSRVPRVHIHRPDRIYRRLRARLGLSKVDVSRVESALATYGLELLGPPRVPLRSGRSQTVVVATSAGKKVLRRYRPTLGLSTILLEHSVLGHLAGAGFPAPRLVPSLRGETLVHLGEERHVLFEFIEGGFHYHNYLLLPSQSRRFVELSGELLGRLHVALAEFEPRGFNPDGFVTRDGDRERGLAWSLELLEKCVEATSNDPQARREAGWLLERAPALGETLTRNGAALDEADLARIVIHADYGPYNVFFRRNADPVVLDFEICRLDWRIAEVILAWDRFCQSRLLGYRLARMEVLLAAYGTAVPLTADEIRLIPAAWRFLSVRNAISYWSRYCESRGQLRHLRREIAKLDWIDANERKLSRRIGTGRSIELAKQPA